MIPSEIYLTPSAARTLRRAVHFCESDDLHKFAGQLVIAFLEEESVAGSLLRAAGLTEDILRAMVTQKERLPSDTPALLPSGDLSAVFAIQRLPEVPGQIVAEATRIARQHVQVDGVGSEHLLAATLQFDTPVCHTLQQYGVTSTSVLESGREAEWADEPIPVSFTLGAAEEPSGKNCCRPAATSTCMPARAIDACMNRAREGIRVLEDYARFMLNDRPLVVALKDLRHRLAESERKFADHHPEDSGSEQLLTERDVSGDVGTDVTGAQELVRRRPVEIVQANARRVQEALRSLEEFGKLASLSFAAEMKQLRYSAYELQQRMIVRSEPKPQSVADCRERLRSARLCVLVSEAGCHHPWKQVVEACLAGGVDMLQLREKHLHDQELLDRAKWLAQACHASDVLCIVNDRSDIARLSGADGVHLGQDDCSVGEARRLIGTDRLIGWSTHSAVDMTAADAVAADYLGVGPVFPSATKQFDRIAGPDLLREAVGCSKPWFAIGGIDEDRAGLVAEAGATRIAVSSSVISSEHPGRVVEVLRQRLHAD